MPSNRIPYPTVQYVHKLKELGWEDGDISRRVKLPVKTIRNILNCDRQPKLEDYDRCDICGHVVVMPCLACYVSRYNHISDFPDEYKPEDILPSLSEEDEIQRQRVTRRETEPCLRKVYP